MLITPPSAVAPGPVGATLLALDGHLGVGVAVAVAAVAAGIFAQVLRPMKILPPKTASGKHAAVSTTPTGSADTVDYASARAVTPASLAKPRRRQNLWTPLEETRAAPDDLVRAGKVLDAGASNFRALAAQNTSR